MKSFLSTRIVRLFLAVSVSIWMAGGCLFGCSGNVMAHEAEDSAQTIVASESCHAHSSQRLTTGPSFTPGPRGMVKDCPLIVNATAATSKNSSHLPDPARGPVAVLPFVETASEQSDTFLVVPVLPNRGPTYLRCCVFLI